MVAGINLRGNMNAIIADLGRTRREVIEKAIPATLNKLADQTKTQAARAIREAGYQIKLPVIKAGISVFYAGGSNRLNASVTARGRPIPLMTYGAREVRGRGVSVNVLNGRKVITNAFITPTANGDRVFVRDGNAVRKALYGPSVADAFKNQIVQDRLLTFNNQKFPIIFEAQIKRFSRR